MHTYITLTYLRSNNTLTQIASTDNQIDKHGQSLIAFITTHICVRKSRPPSPNTQTYTGLILTNES